MGDNPPLSWGVAWGPGALYLGARLSTGLKEALMSADPIDLVTVPRAEIDMLRAEVRRLRRPLAREEAKALIRADLQPVRADT